MSYIRFPLALVEYSLDRAGKITPSPSYKKPSPALLDPDLAGPHRRAPSTVRPLAFGAASLRVSSPKDAETNPEGALAHSDQHDADADG